MCEKVVEGEFEMLQFIPDQLKREEMYNKAVEGDARIYPLPP